MPVVNMYMLAVSMILLSLQGDNVTWYIIKVVGSDSSVGVGLTVCATSPCVYVHQVTHIANKFSIFVTSLDQDLTLGSPNGTTTFGK